RRGQHGAEAASLAAGPKKKSKSDEQQERSGDALQEADGFDSSKNYKNVEEPEENEANGRAGRKARPRRRKRYDHGVDGFAADPGLDAEPAAGNKSAQNGGNVGAENAEGSARKNRERDAVLRAGVGVEQHGNQHQNVAEKNGEERLPPVHAARNHAAGKHVRGDVHAHGNPQRGVIVGAPDTAFAGDGSEVLVVERAVLNGFGAKRGAVNLTHREGLLPFLSRVVTAFATDEEHNLAGRDACRGLRAHDFAIRFRAAIAVELPGIADFLN